MWAEHIHAGQASATSRGGRLARRFHRIVAMLFVGTVAANFAAMPFGMPAAWITYAPLLPLLVLTVTGLVLLVAERGGKQ